jgi:hypothetical protein
VKTPGISAFVLKSSVAPSREVRREICSEINADAAEDSVAWAQFSTNPTANNRWVDLIPMITGGINAETYAKLNETLDVRDRDIVFVGVQPSIFTVLLGMIVINDRAVQLC